MENHELSTRFETLLQALKVSHIELAKKAKIKKTDTIYHVKTGKCKPSFETLLRIVKAFPETNLYYLFGLEDEPIRHSRKEPLLYLHKMITSKTKF